jgi:putative transposase
MRLFPTRLQVGKLEELSKTRNLLWNEMIEIEEKAFEEKHLIGEFDLNNMLPALKEEYPEYKVLNSKACQRICKEVYSSYRSFFRLVKKDKTAKPPRKVGNVEQFHTVVFNQSGWKFIDNENVRLNGIVIQYKGMSGIDFTTLNVKEVRLKKKNGKYMLDVMHEKEIEEPKEIKSKNKVLAIDLGLKELATGVDNLGKVVVLKNKAARIDKYFAREIGKVKSKLSKKQRNSRSWVKLRKTKKRLYKRRNAQVRDTLHIQSRRLADMNYKVIVVGDLSVKKLMSKEGINDKKKNIRKGFQETSIGRFMEYLTYKCLSRHNEVMTLSERWTTQTNCLTGKLFKEKVSLSDREVWLNETVCIDRDLNAAINIMRRYEQCHIALMTTPLDISNVVARHNLATNLQNSKGTPSL